MKKTRSDFSGAPILLEIKHDLIVAIFFAKKICTAQILPYICIRIQAEVAQLVELQPSKLVVASSSLVFRSKALEKSEAFLFLGRF